MLMAVGLALEILLPIGIVVAVVAVSFLVGRGRRLKCPDCGTVFSPPPMDTKRSGMGRTLPYMGSVKCPKCGESRSRRDYQKAPPPTQAPT